MKMLKHFKRIPIIMNGRIINARPTTEFGATMVLDFIDRNNQLHSTTEPSRIYLKDGVVIRKEWFEHGQHVKTDEIHQVCTNWPVNVGNSITMHTVAAKRYYVLAQQQ